MEYKQEPLKSLPSHWVMVDGCRMHYRVAGRGPQAVVLVHGLTVSGDYLLPTALALLDDFTVYVPDLPGFGLSEKPRHVLTIVEMAETLRAWMDAIGLERAYLLGNSLGCHTIAVMAARYPEHVAGTILVSPWGDPDGRNMLRLVPRALNDFLREPPSLWLIMLRDFWKAGLRRTILTMRNLQKCRIEAWLTKVNLPALVVGGKRDRIVPTWWTEHVAALLPQGQLALLAGAGHVSNFSHPVPLAALARRFVESNGGTEG